MLRVGLTGGIASGKSAVAGTLAEVGAVVIDADELAREVVAPGTDGLRQVRARFGDGVLQADGHIDRAALAQRIFTDDGARRDLEAIVHPLVRTEARRREVAAARSDPDAVVVQMIPLLVETGQAGPNGGFDVVVVVDTEPAEQLRRLTRDRGMTDEQARARLAAQASRQERLAAADLVITNDGSLEQLRAHVLQVWDQLRSRARTASGSSGQSAGLDSPGAVGNG